MKKFWGSVIVSLLVLNSVFADWDNSISFGMSFPYFNQKIVADGDDDISDDGDDSKICDIGFDGDFQGRFVNRNNNLALLAGIGVGYITVDAEDFFGSDEFSGNVGGINYTMMGGVGYRIVDSRSVKLIASGVAAFTYLNLSTTVKGIEDGVKMDVDVDYVSYQFDLGADVYAQFNFNRRWALAASVTALFTVANSGTLDMTAKGTYEGISVSVKEPTIDTKLDGLGFVIIPRIAAVFRF